MTRPPRARVAATAATVARGHLHDFRMHAMFGDVVDAHGLERARADVQRDVREFGACVATGLEHRCVEMQAGRRRRHRAGLAGIDGLVALAVGRFGSPPEIRRQRHFAVPLEYRVRGGAELDQPEAARRDPATVAVSPPGRRTSVPARAGLLERNCTSARVAAQQALQQDLDPAAAVALVPRQARRDHARVVEDQQIAWPQQAGQVDDLAVAVVRPCDRPGAAAGRHCAAAADGGRSARREGRNGSRCAAWGAHASRGPGGAGPLLCRDRYRVRTDVRVGARPAPHGLRAALAGRAASARTGRAEPNVSPSCDDARAPALRASCACAGAALRPSLSPWAGTSPGSGRRGAGSPVCGHRCVRSTSPSSSRIPGVVGARTTSRPLSVPKYWPSLGVIGTSSSEPKARRVPEEILEVGRHSRRPASARAACVPSAALPRPWSPTAALALPVTQVVELDRLARLHAAQVVDQLPARGRSPLRRSGLPSTATSTSPFVDRPPAQDPTG